MKKICVLGASGIIGQHMRLIVPEGVTPIWVRSVSDDLHVGVDLNNWEETKKFLDKEQPDAIVNLAGESRPDVVQFMPHLSYGINVALPQQLATWCSNNKAHYVHVSSQAVFDGKNPPYSADSEQGHPVNEYGIQKQLAEQAIRGLGTNWTIVRPTFVLGVRPWPSVGRENPIEQMLSGKYKYQVNDKFFSVSFARDVAQYLWSTVLTYPYNQAICNVGIPYRISRYQIAQLLGVSCTPVPSTYFKDIAPRPFDTTYAGGKISCPEERIELLLGLEKCKTEYLTRMLNGK